MAGTAARLMRLAAWKSRSNVASHCSSVVSRKLVRMWSPPALFTRASTRPYCSSTVAITRSGAAGSVTSAVHTYAEPPAPSISDLALSSLSVLRATRIGMAPSAVTVTAVARPMPDKAPLITIILSVSWRSTMCSLGVEDRGRSVHVRAERDVVLDIGAFGRPVQELACLVRGQAFVQRQADTGCGGGRWGERTVDVPDCGQRPSSDAVAAATPHSTSLSVACATVVISDSSIGVIACAVPPSDASRQAPSMYNRPGS